MNKFILTLILGVTLFNIILTVSFIKGYSPSLFEPKQENEEEQQRILDKYSIEALKIRSYMEQKIEIGEISAKGKEFETRYFKFATDGKTVTGLINLPRDTLSPNPVIILLRGYVDREIYTPGTGSKRVGEAFASANLITLAPDFLGYGQSSSPSAYPLEERFETYTAAVNLLKSVANLNEAFLKSGIPNKADMGKIGIWGHSNGGHIALALLEISGVNFPTVLWAPVSRSFPYSILFYSDEFEDEGRSLRKVLADFEKDYDSNKYSITKYLDEISAPIQLHQGEEDLEVPRYWSDEFTEILKEKNKNIEYYTYAGENHNFQQGSWNTAVQRSLNFYRQHFSDLAP